MQRFFHKFFESDSSDDDDSNDEYFEGHHRAAKRLKIVTAETSAIVDRSGISDRSCSRIVSSVAKNLGLDINKLAVSYSNI